MIVEHRFAHIPQDGRRGRAWVSSHAPFLEVRLDPATPVPLEVFHRYHHLGKAVFADFAAPAQEIERSDRLVATQALDHIALQVHACGRARIDADGLVAVASPGDVILLDLARAVRIDTEPSAGAWLVVPRRSLEGPPGATMVPHGRILAASAHPLAGLFGSHLIHLAACLPTASADQRRFLLAATLDLCRVIVQVAVAGGAGSPVITHELATGMSMRRFIEDNLERVDVPMLMARFGLSRRSLYRRFDDKAGVQGYIRDRRLVSAMRRLERGPDGKPVKIARLAHASGFDNPRVFSRAFHRKYGSWPTALREASRPPGGTAGDTPPWAWLRDL